MEKLQRQTQKIFGSNAPSDDIAALGSFKAGSPIYTDDIAALQSAAYEQGYSAALIADEAPMLEEQNSIPYILSKQLAYQFQEGIAEYDTGTTYYKGSIVKKDNAELPPMLYYSLTDDNINNPLTDEANWAEYNLSGANTSLSNLTAAGEKHFFGKTQITNCILELPQTIKIETSGQTLTLKAGSKMIYPNGSNVFDEVVLTNDLTLTIASSVNQECFLIGLPGRSSITYSTATSACYSGDTAPSVSGTNYYFWWDTNANIVKYHRGDEVLNGYSLPLAKLTVVNGVITVDTVFNGVGYMGSTVWTDKNLRGLAPNGRTSDGRLNNKDLVTTQILTKTVSDAKVGAKIWCRGDTISYGTGYTYNPQLNIIEHITQANIVAFECALYDSDADGRITSWVPLLPVNLASIFSPEFYGVPKTPTPAVSDNSTQIANTAWVNALLSNLLTSALYFKSGANYIEFFSDVLKTQRIALMQWGRASFSAAHQTITVTLPTAFTDTSFSVTGTSEVVEYSGDISYGNVGCFPTSTTTFSASNERSQAYPGYFRWIAIGK